MPFSLDTAFLSESLRDRYDLSEDDRINAAVCTYLPPNDLFIGFAYFNLAAVVAIYSRMVNATEEDLRKRGFHADIATRLNIVAKNGFEMRFDIPALPNVRQLIKCPGVEKIPNSPFLLVNGVLLNTELLQSFSISRGKHAQ